MAFAVGNRSACLFHLGDFEHAINDIHFALSINYPKANKAKLYERLGRCHQKLFQMDKARTAFMICQQLTPDDKLKATLDEVISKCNKCDNNKFG